jgi:hypothetical protein
MRGILAKRPRPTIIYVSSGVFIGYYVTNLIKVIDRVTLILGK